MKVKMISKRATAFILCLVMLLSCWVFIAPASVAEDTADTARGKYDVKVTIEVTHRGWFDSSNGYQGLSKEEGASCGVSVVCKDQNGAAQDGEEYAWDLGTNTEDGLNYADVVGSYTLTAEDVGFPYIVGGYICGKWMSTEANTQKTIQIQKLEVRAGDKQQDDAYITLWEGVLQLSTKINGYGGYIENNGEVTGWQNGIMNADNGKVGTDSNNYIEGKEPWDMPHADSLQVNDSTENVWPSQNALELTNNETTIAPAAVDCLDQYGAVITNPTKTVYGIKAYDYAAYGLAQSDLQMNAQGIIGKTGTSYIAGNSQEHTLTTEVSCFFGSKKVENETTAAVAQLTTVQTIIYPAFSVIWKYKLSTDQLNSTSWGSVESTALLGNEVEDADYPGEEVTRYYYTKGNHYNDGKFETVQVEGAIELEMGDYTETPHSITVPQQIEGDDVKHNLKCSGCDYAVSAVHTFNEGAVTKEATCKETGVFTKTCSVCEYLLHTEIPKVSSHSWSEGVITKDPTCFENGILTKTCSICGEIQEKPIGQLTHNVQMRTAALVNGINGSVYYECTYCHNYWATSYNAQTGEFDFVDEETYYPTLEEAMSVSGENLPAPEFNVYNDIVGGYNYNTRGASLRYGGYDSAPLKQPLRFTGSVKVPEGVSYQIGSGEQEVIIDAGYVFTQTEYIQSDINRLVVGSGDEKIKQLSLKERNSDNGVFTGHNWDGFSVHEAADGTHLTFNIVIAVERYNWKAQYCVRPYITYKVGECEVTVYDDTFSSRSVQQIAQNVLDNEGESAKAKTYCQKLMNIIQKEA